MQVYQNISKVNYCKYTVKYLSIRNYINLVPTVSCSSQKNFIYKNIMAKILLSANINCLMLDYTSLVRDLQTFCSHS